MNFFNGGRPASGSEQMFSHAWMMQLCLGAAFLILCLIIGNGGLSLLMLVVIAELAMMSWILYSRLKFQHHELNRSHFNFACTIDSPEYGPFIQPKVSVTSSDITLDVQSGGDQIFPGIVKELQNIKGDVLSMLLDFGLPECKSMDVLSCMESFLFLFAKLRLVKDRLARGVIFMDFVRTLLPEQSYIACSSRVKSYFDDLQCQSGEEEPDDFVCLFDDWVRWSGSETARNLSNVFDILLTLRFFPDWVRNAKMRDLRIFHKHAWDLKRNSQDFLSMMMGTLTFFAKRAYVAIRDKDFSLLYICESDAKDIDDELSTLISVKSLYDQNKLELIRDPELQHFESYLLRLERMIEKLSIRLKHENDVRTQNMLRSDVLRLKKIRDDLIGEAQNAEIRVAPLAISIYGASGVGKSTITTHLIKASLSGMGKPYGPAHICAKNENDQYDSAYDHKTTCTIYDDVGAAKPEFSQNNIANDILNVVNNAPRTAVKADVDSKGKIQMRHFLSVITSNRPDLGVHDYMNNPEAVLRRLSIQAQMILKKEFRGREGKYSGPKNYLPDAWEFIVFNGAIDIKGQYQRIRVGKMDTYEFFQYVHNFSRDYLKDQEEIVRYVRHVSDSPACCHGLTEDMCLLCNPHLSTQTGVIAASAAAVGADFFLAPLRPWWHTFVHTFLCQSVLKLCYRVLGTRYASYSEAVRNRLARADVRTRIMMGVSVVGVIIASYKLYKLVSRLTTQGGLFSFLRKPEVGEESKLDTTDMSKTSYPTPVPVDLPLSLESKTTVPEALRKKLAKNQFYLSYEVEGKRQFCNALGLCAYTYLVPYHVVATSESIVARLSRSPDSVLDVHSCDIIDRSTWVRIPGRDLALVNLTSAGLRADITKFFLVGRPSGVISLTGHYRNREKKIEEYNIRTNVKMRKETCRHVGFSNVETEGFYYEGAIVSFPGLCGMVMLTDTKNPAILGIHTAGRNGQNTGFCSVVTQEELNFSLESLRKLDSLPVCSSGEMQSEMYGIDYGISKDYSPKNPVGFMTPMDGDMPSLTFAGSHTRGTAKFNTKEIQPTMFSSDIEKAGIPRDHKRPPKRPEWVDYQRDNSLISHLKGKWQPKVLRRALADYENMVFPQISEEMYCTLKPMDDVSVLSGLDGIRGFERINQSTSAGFPWNASKRVFFQPLDTPYVGISDPLQVADEIWDLIDDWEESLSQGKRINTIFRQNLKVEVIKNSKDKIRVFAGAQLPFTILFRRYYLPLVRLIQDKQTLFEQAVGVNALGKEWGELADFVFEYGTENIIGGDYAAYDKTMAARLILLAFEFLIRLAKRSGHYSERDIRIMEGIAIEVAYPVYEVMGSFIQAYGSNPSGHPGTVIINGIVGSIIQRYAFFMLADKNKCSLPFHEVSRLLCYGDDNLQGVKPGFDWWNHTAIQEILSDVGMAYTMPDKEQESKPYLDLSEATFLKRGFVKDPDMGWLAPLDESSIAKSLHWWMDRKSCVDTPEFIAAQALENANSEYFRHGMAKHETKRLILQSILEKYDLTEHVGYLKNYAQLKEEYLEQNQ